MVLLNKIKPYIPVLDFLYGCFLDAVPLDIAASDSSTGCSSLVFVSDPDPLGAMFVSTMATAVFWAMLLFILPPSCGPSSTLPRLHYAADFDLCHV